jgi:xanthine phosphoribosyltransferase
MNKLIIDDKMFKGLVANICRDISNDGWRPDYVVGITRGGLPAATMISHYFDVRMEALKVSLRDSDTGPESNLWMAEDAYGYGGVKKKILIVDDINDSGATLEWIINDWKSSCLPNDPEWNNIWSDNVRFAVVVNNSGSKFLYNTYNGMEINKSEKDVWVEFPYENWWA